jgi:hypothetical protein
MSYVCDRVGTESVMDGFKIHDCSYFSVWQGKTLKFKYIGGSAEDAANFLMQNIEGLHPNSTALYEIRLYDDVPDKGINNSTPYSGSFTFKMNTGIGTDASVYRPVGSDQYTKHLQTENEMMKKRIEALEAEEVEDEEPADGVGRIMGYIEKYPALQEILRDGIGMLKNVFNQRSGNNHMHHQAISGVIDPALPAEDKLMAALGMLTQNDPGRLSTLANALAGLLDRDPDLLSTLDKLSKMDQSKFNMAKSFL